MFPVVAITPAVPVSWSNGPAIHQTADSALVPEKEMRWNITGLTQPILDDDFGLVSTVELQKQYPQWQAGNFTAPEGRYLDIDVEV
jgi:hypothetical protein